MIIKRCTVCDMTNDSNYSHLHSNEIQKHTPIFKHPKTGDYICQTCYGTVYRYQSVEEVLRDDPPTISSEEARTFTVS